MLSIRLLCLLLSQIATTAVLAKNFLTTQHDGAYFIDIPTDHFSDNSVNFKNRYWVNATYYKGGPVFIFDAGEQDAAPLHPYYLQEYHGQSAVMQLAKRFNGLAILWEHRYYGQSLPFPINDKTTADQWSLLTVEQALEDVVSFANSFGSTNDTASPLSLNVSPSTTPWIWLGASYPGVRGALLRQKSPWTIYAAWASSAPVQAQVGVADFSKVVERHLPRNCSADWVAVTRHVDSIFTGNNETLKDETRLRLMKAKLSKPGGDTTVADQVTLQVLNQYNVTNSAATWLMSDPSLAFQYYGAASLLPFCNALETRNSTISPLETGIAAKFGIEAAFSSVLTALSEVKYLPRITIPDAASLKSWTWQRCSEYGLAITGDASNPLPIISSLHTEDEFLQGCKESFPTGLPAMPELQNINHYGGWNINPPNVMFTNGESDPHGSLSVASRLEQSPQRIASAAVPRCNEAPPKKSFFGINYPNMVHGPDMRVLLTPDSNHTDFKTIGYHSPISREPFDMGLALFQTALEQWLPCYQPGRKQ